MQPPQAPVVPGEYLCAEGTISLNEGADRIELDVVNTGDRPVQVGSHVHFPQANSALDFDREAAHGRRLDIPAGTAVRFEPGLAQRVSLVPLGGTREVYGISLNAPGPLDIPPPPGWSASTERGIMDGTL
ncbi:urease subunit beta [Nocardia sp. CDC153]|uniref:urease subunit beta n=1 Tax=Nocardia sp. CDC153 TaxID=3112167 RepID=UPI002DBE76BF|nr:urease subunit beta [Nocardia sp. CDC153]MEC3956010.1 urease subunit beta [Nocardia sp. CDC153]